MRSPFLALLLAPSLALACWNEVRLNTDAEAKAVDKAQVQLQQGDPAAAIATLRATYGQKAVLFPDRITSSEPLGRKARGLISIAMIRDGRIDPKSGQAANKSRRSQLRRLATDWLRRAALSDDPLARARHAEALSQDPKQAKAARAALEQLAQDDLLAEAEAWLALARLRSAAGEAEGAQHAVGRCVTLASTARCTLPAAGGT